MPADIVIRGGTVVDGTRRAGPRRRRGDRRWRDPGDRAEPAAASRSWTRPVASSRPGFIDIHTHYDAQVFWDPALRPSSYQGVTTVVAGNCGFTIAPTRPEHHDVIVRTLENVEDMDAASLTAGIVWDFQTHPEYLELVRRRGTELNFTAYVGHSSVRLYVMGDAAYERAATPDEIERDVPRSSPRRSRRARPGSPPASPTRTAGSTASRCRAASRSATKSGRCSWRPAGRGRGSCSPPPGEQCTYADMYEWQAAHRAAVHLPAVCAGRRATPPAARS